MAPQKVKLVNETLKLKPVALTLKLSSPNGS